MSRATALVLLSGLLGICLAPARAADLATARADLLTAYAAKLAGLADWCREQQLPEAAESLRAWLPPRDPDKLTLFLLPPTAAEPANSKAAPADADQSPAASWRVKWQELRDQQAESLMALATQAIAEQHASLAFELVTEAVRENPDHALARKILGYTRYHEAWHTAFEIRQLAAGKVWHEKFGWLPRGHVQRYENGQRYYKGRWTTVAEEASLRSELAHGWRIESEHYVVTTNHSLEAGVELSRRLEMLSAVWQQVFAPFLAGKVQFARRFEGRAPRYDARQHEVIYYRTRDEYNDALRGAQAQIDRTLGIYFDSTRTAYFFAGDDQSPGTLYHEATHQLFHETRGVAAEVARAANFWIVEGVACYMESLDKHEGYCTLGGTNAGRMPAARHRVLTDGFYVPLAELVTLGMESLQRDPRIAPIYSQSAGLADFLMHDGAGRYREALVGCLEAVYTNRATTQTLADLTGATYDTLDRQYRGFMSQDEPASTATPGAAR